MIKIELLIPTKQYSNIKFFVEAKDEKELDEKITRLWRKYFNFFEIESVKKQLNKVKDDFEQETDIEASYEKDGFVPKY